MKNNLKIKINKNELNKQNNLTMVAYFLIINSKKNYAGK